MTAAPLPQSARHTPEDFEIVDVTAVNSQVNGPLYVAREKIFPKRVNGFFRSLKWFIMAVTLGIYYVTPWLRWDRGFYAPDQAVLVDLANRRFYFFFIEIWPHEFFFVAGMLVMAGVGLFLITSTVGRAWCGYTCPQTVWVDLFLTVERVIEGDRNARIKLDKAPWDLAKLTKRGIKHACWLAIAVATGGAWIFYFADAPTLLGDLIAGQASFYAYATIALLTATTYVFGGILREQVCTYICPWPRIQGAMLDEDSLTVTYNDWRGEPRSRHAKKARAQGLAVGDCVDCNACVAVCPMGIDIRDGQQMECITCALCIDACDVVMRKTGREQGLIAYATLRDYNDNVARAQAATPPSNAHTVGPRNATTATPLLDFDPARVRGADGALQPGFKSTTLRSFVRPRTLIYTVIWGAIGLALLTALLIRDRLDVNVLRDRNPVYVVLSNGDVRNGYEIKVLNMMPRLRSFTLGIDGLPGGFMTLAGSNGPPTKQLALAVAADRLRSVRVYVRVPRANLTAKQTPFDFVVKEIDGRETARYAARFDAPERR